jgi:hypothetical protein
MSKRSAAKTVRIITIPPLLVTATLLLLYFGVPEIFRGGYDLVFSILFLAVIPTLAYPLQPIIPYFKDKGRSGQRTLAFISSGIGYIGGMLYAFISGVTSRLLLIFASYFLSVIVLTVFNKLLKFKASGHACGVMGPLIFTVYFLGWGWLLPCMIIGAGVIWSSICLARHTPNELFLGGMSAALAFTLCIII